MVVVLGSRLCMVVRVSALDMVVQDRGSACQSTVPAATGDVSPASLVLAGLLANVDESPCVETSVPRLKISNQADSYLRFLQMEEARTFLEDESFSIHFLRQRHFSIHLLF